MIVLALLLMTAEPAKASVVDVSGDVVVDISFDARAASVTGEAELTQEGKALLVRAKRSANATVGFGAQKVEKLIVRDGARVMLHGFAGKALEIVASGAAVVVVKGKGISLVIDGSGTSRVDTDELTVENANVTLKDAARASVKATKRLTCDLKRASRLVVTGKPTIEKTIAGVAKLELK